MIRRWFARRNLKRHLRIGPSEQHITVNRLREAMITLTVTANTKEFPGAIDAPDHWEAMIEAKRNIIAFCTWKHGEYIGDDMEDLRESEEALK